MPKQYEEIKASEMKSGKDKPTAERIAAATFNKNRPAGAVAMGPNYESRLAASGQSDPASSNPLRKTIRSSRHSSRRESARKKLPRNRPTPQILQRRGLRNRD